MDLVTAITVTSGSVGCRGNNSVLSPEGRFMLILMYLVLLLSSVRASSSGLPDER